MADNHEKKRPFRFSKLDIKDGFWRVKVIDDAWSFFYVLPLDKVNGSMDEIKKNPNSLQMGWCESSPFFCAVTETIRNIITKIVTEILPPHPLEHKMTRLSTPQLPSIPPPINPLSAPDTTLIGVYVGDFIRMTNNQDKKSASPLSVQPTWHTFVVPASVTHQTWWWGSSVRKRS